MFIVNKDLDVRIVYNIPGHVISSPEICASLFIFVFICHCIVNSLHSYSSGLYSFSMCVCSTFFFVVYKCILTIWKRKVYIGKVRF